MNKIKGLCLVALSTILPMRFISAEGEIEGVIGNITRTLTTIGGVLAVLFIVIAGVTMIMSSEDAKNVENAKGMIKWAMIGLGVVLLANILSAIVQNLTGVTIK